MIQNYILKLKYRQLKWISQAIITIAVVLLPIYSAVAQLDIANTDMNTNASSWNILSVPFYFIYGAGYKIPTTESNLVMPVAAIILALFSVLGLIFFILMIYGGLIWTSAGGNEERVDKAKKIIKDGLLGLIIVLASYTITYFTIYLIAVATGDVTFPTLRNWYNDWKNN